MAGNCRCNKALIDSKLSTQPMIAGARNVAVGVLLGPNILAERPLFRRANKRTRFRFRVSHAFEGQPIGTRSIDSSWPAAP